MVWRIEFDDKAKKDLDSLDHSVADRISKYLEERVAPLDDPRSIGDPLKGANLGGLWRYRVGDYRIITRIKDSVLCVLVVRIGHRKDVYN